MLANDLQVDLGLALKTESVDEERREVDFSGWPAVQQAQEMHEHVEAQQSLDVDPALENPSCPSQAKTLVERKCSNRLFQHTWRKIRQSFKPNKVPETGQFSLQSASSEDLEVSEYTSMEILDFFSDWDSSLLDNHTPHNLSEVGDDSNEQLIQDVSVTDDIVPAKECSSAKMEPKASHTPLPARDSPVIKSDFRSSVKAQLFDIAAAKKQARSHQETRHSPLLPSDHSSNRLYSSSDSDDVFAIRASRSNPGLKSVLRDDTGAKKTKRSVSFGPDRSPNKEIFTVPRVVSSPAKMSSQPVLHNHEGKGMRKQVKASKIFKDGNDVKSSTRISDVLRIEHSAIEPSEQESNLISNLGWLSEVSNWGIWQPEDENLDDSDELFAINNPAEMLARAAMNDHDRRQFANSLSPERRQAYLSWASRESNRIKRLVSSTSEPSCTSDATTLVLSQHDRGSGSRTPASYNPYRDDNASESGYNSSVYDDSPEVSESPESVGSILPKKLPASDLTSSHFSLMHNLMMINAIREDAFCVKEVAEIQEDLREAQSLPTAERCIINEFFCSRLIGLLHESHNRLEQIAAMAAGSSSELA